MSMQMILLVVALVLAILSFFTDGRLATLALIIVIASLLYPMVGH